MRSLLAVMAIVLASVPAAMAETQPDETSNDERRTWHIVGVVTATTGLALVATAFAYRNAAHDREDVFDTAVQDGLPWDDGQGDAYQRWQSTASTSRILTGVGVMAIVTGSLIYYFTPSVSDKDQESTLSLKPTLHLKDMSTEAGFALGMNF